MKKASQYFGEFAIDSVDLPLLALCQKIYVFLATRKENFNRNKVLDAKGKHLRKIAEPCKHLHYHWLTLNFL
jgi:hypothetical protein